MESTVTRKSPRCQPLVCIMSQCTLNSGQCRFADQVFRHQFIKPFLAKVLKDPAPVIRILGRLFMLDIENLSVLVSCIFLSLYLRIAPRAVNSDPGHPNSAPMESAAILYLLDAWLQAGRGCRCYGIKWHGLGCAGIWHWNSGSHHASGILQFNGPRGDGLSGPFSGTPVREAGPQRRPMGGTIVGWEVPWWANSVSINDSLLPTFDWLKASARSSPACGTLQCHQSSAAHFHQVLAAAWPALWWRFHDVSHLLYCRTKSWLKPFLSWSTGELL